ncbi:hypothetical protein [Rhizobium leguminosarum]|uniref:hypothetical protein n=1 Tax=Rhizobium leguminosarum TaxID=384 RepID=UPI0012DB096C|nr:hypothetical protein [Rhizobium leguminosarum]
MKKPVQRSRPGEASNTHKSAFDDQDALELTALGTQFVHYAMSDVPTKIDYQPQRDEDYSGK